MFDYSEFTTRNIGFVTEAEQQELRAACVFVCGTGGMGGACIVALARMGIGKLIIADIDHFELSNLNRQPFAFLHTVDQHKAEATRDQCLQINPEMDIEVLHEDWPDHVERAVGASCVVVNGTDDLGASLLLYRTARQLGCAVIDAYASPLPSIYVTGPNDPSPEERLGYPTQDVAWNALTDAQRQASFAKEAEHILIHSSSRHHLDLTLAGEVAAGKRSRMSFAPMVLSTGMLMAYEVTNAALGRGHNADYRGWFFNPYKARVEKPKPWLLEISMRPMVRYFLKKLIGS